MKAVIVNDTSNDRHHGCSRVMDYMYRALNSHGIEVIDRSLLNADLTAPNLVDNINRCDLVIVNGEGTIHHGRKYAESILRLVADSTADTKVLINSTYDSNPARFGDYLKAFDLIYVRDSQSRSELQAIGLSAAVVPDMTFLGSRSPIENVRRGILVCDSVDREVLVGLHARRRTLGRTARPISIFEPQPGFLGLLSEVRSSLGRKDIVNPLRAIRIARSRAWFARRTAENHDRFSATIGQAEFLLSGRYHAICMAVKNRTPFLAIDSNTFKIQALLNDIGLSDRCMRKADFLAGEALKIQPFGPDELALIDRFDQRAIASIGKMFEQIVSHG